MCGALLLAAACGPGADGSPFGEVCGREKPVRLLELGPNEAPGDVRMAVATAGRLVFAVGQRASAGPGLVSEAVWSTGPCGESPVRLADGITELALRPELGSDVVLGCRPETGDLLALHPRGEQAPAVVFPGVGCRPSFTPHGIVVVRGGDEHLGALTLYPYPSDPYGEPSAPLVLLDGVRRHRLEPAPYTDAHQVLHVAADEVLAVDAGDRLVRVALPSGAVTVEMEGVQIFDASEEHILWQSLAPDDAAEIPIGPVTLRDRATGVETFLLQAALAWSAAPLAHGPSVARIKLGPVLEAPERFVFLPELAFVDVPADRGVQARIDDDRWLVRVLAGDAAGGWAVRELRTGQEVALAPGGDGRLYAGDDLEVLDVPEGDPYAQGELRRWPLHGGSSELLASRATRARRWLDDGRLLTVIEIDPAGLGALVVVDPNGLNERALDEQVWASSLELGDAFEDGSFAYAVADGERSGIWRARVDMP